MAALPGRVVVRISAAFSLIVNRCVFGMLFSLLQRHNTRQSTGNMISEMGESHCLRFSLSERFLAWNSRTKWSSWSKWRSVNCPLSINLFLVKNVSFLTDSLIQVSCKKYCDTGIASFLPIFYLWWKGKASSKPKCRDSPRLM
jgi:hypothetical protein